MRSGSAAGVILSSYSLRVRGRNVLKGVASGAFDDTASDVRGRPPRHQRVLQWLALDAAKSQVGRLDADVKARALVGDGAASRVAH